MSALNSWRRSVLLAAIAATCAASGETAYAAGDAPAGDGHGPHQRSTWNVAPDGRGQSCMRWRPCRLETAREQVRAAAPAMTRDLRVELAGGRYELSSTFVLGAADSGRNGHDVVYAAAPGAEPVLTGGREVRGWRLVDPARRIWRAAVGRLDTRQLYADDVRLRRAVHVPGLPGDVRRTATGLHTTSAEPRTWAAPTDVEMVWRARGAGAFEWVEARCRVTGMSADAAGTGTDVSIAQPCLDNAVGIYASNVAGGGEVLGAPSWSENSSTFLADDTRPARWAIERTAAGNAMHYRARPGEDPRRRRFVAATGETLVRIGGTVAEPAHDIVVRGLRFSESTWLGPDTGMGFPNLFANAYAIRPDALSPETYRGEAFPPGALELDKTHDVRVEGNRFERLGAIGVRIQSTSRATVDGNVLRDLSAGGVLIGRLGPDLEGEVEDNVISNNAIDGVGAEYGASPGVFLNVPRRTTLRNNFISNTGYSGVTMRGSWNGSGTTEGNRYVDNYVANVLRRASDGGGIYTVYPQGTSWDNGLLVAGNVVRDMRPGALGFGLYNDIGSDYSTSRDNVSYNFLIAGGGCAQPYLNEIRSTGNWLRGRLPGVPDVWWVCDGPVTNVEVDNHSLDAADPAADCAARPACAAIVANAGLQAGYEDRLTGTYSFDDVPTFEDVNADSFDVDSVHAGLDFGWGQWIAAYGTPGYATTSHARFATADAGPRTIAPVRGVVLSSLVLEGSGTYTISDGTSTRSGTLRGPGRPVRVQTGFRTTGAKVSLTFSDGQQVVVDDLRVSR
ncbi:right-handed parallel beta-helix repeat-containing protein [Conexibacter woesei]|uniref:Periplasmic copper-binding protein NosD beta helix domain-containing protein n=1 Tax=Conexibacter woesei (strain DSM 14684 / CCUG 47730 / CIP 108061 / JCM 11494 / NBRC 100937 / ID131577) TaxID=469383 RepID=D3FDB5_CONWI|nr:right-handed parallel beta-helix repeat-containing protein [Conexibacter woesei]ADB53507.1 hypothetical protein Cwoe_5098 [Conexibacter woesei DSM 14684]